MKRIAIASLLVMCLAGSAYGQAGNINLYADAAYTQCNVVGASGLMTVYVVLENAGETTGVEYQVQNNSGGGLMYIADQNSYTLVIGNANDGVAIVFDGACLGAGGAQVEVQKVLYTVLFDPAACASLDIVPDPGALSGNIERTDCQSPPNTFNPAGGKLTFNADGTCPCGSANPVEETNWGRIKALYN